MKRVLVVSRQRLIGATNGSSAYLIQLAEAIRAAGMEPHLLQPSPSVMGRVPFFRRRPEMAVFASHRIRGVTQVGDWFVVPTAGVWRDAATGTVAAFARRLGLRGAWTRDRPRPYAIAEPWSEEDRAWLRRTSSEAGGWDMVIADYAFQAEAFAALGTARSRSAIVMHDLFHARAGSGAGANRDSVALVSREEELTMLARAGTVIAIQQEEADFLREYLPRVRVVLAPTAFAPSQGVQPGDPLRLLFVGSRTAPNTDGLAWFCEKVWPQLRAASPGTRLDVVGTVGVDFAGRVPEGVELHGLVPDLAPFYDRAGIVISPLRFGSGLKIKLVEALARGKPMVVTGVTLQGVAHSCGPAVLQADEAESFAAAILVLQRDAALRQELSAQALATVERHFAPAAAHRALREWLQVAVNGSEGGGRLLPPEARAAISCFQ